MKSLLNSVLVTIIISSVASCTPSMPYEIKSPCVSVDSGSSSAITPCVRRPVNLSRAIV